MAINVVCNYDEKRKLWIDSLRSIAIIMVVLGHQIPTEIDFFVYTSTVKMPLFFAISGYLFNDRGGNTILFLNKIFWSLIFPWLSLGVISCVPTLRYGVSFFLETIKDLIIGERLWFMPCLILGELLFFFIYRRNNMFKICILCICCSSIGFVMHKCDVFNFMKINTAFIVQSFFMIGIIYREIERKYLHKINVFGISFLFAICIFLTYIASLLFPNECIDVHKNQYFNIPYCFVLIIISCITVFLLFDKIDISNKILVFIGQNSLIIYIYHGIFIAIFVKILFFMNIVIDNNILFGIIKTIYACLVCSILSYFLNKFFPVLVGKKKSKHVSVQK